MIRRLVLALVLGFALAIPSLSGAHGKGIARFAWRHCDQKHPRVCLRAAARKHDQDLAEAMRVVKCENDDLDPLAVNPTPVSGEHASGLMQILPSTFATAGRRFDHRPQLIWSARWNSMAAMALWHAGRKGEWSCA